jgi:integrase/recombinase XerD
MINEVRDVLYKEIVNEILLHNSDIVDSKNKLYSILNNYNVSLFENNPNIYDVQINIDKYIRDKIVQGTSPKTIGSYKNNLNTFNKYNTKRLQEINKEDILSFFEYLRERNSTIMTSTLENVRYILQGFFNWAKDNCIIIESPMAKIKPFKVERRLGRTLTVTELEIIRYNCKTLREHALIEVAYSTGCRLSELVSINKKDVDWQNERLKVIGKGNAERYVFLSERTIIHLKRYLESRNDSSEALFVSGKGKHNRLSGRSIEDAVKKIEERCGFEKGFSPHCFRRSLFSNLAAHECPITVIQGIAGHSRLDTTQRYITISPEFKQQSFKKYQYQ